LPTEPGVRARRPGSGARGEYKKGETLILRKEKPLLFAVLAALSALAHAQSAPALALPLDCEIGKACIVQNYVDRDPGPGARDYRCGFLTYDGHKGTDIRVIDTQAYRRGVSVLAAASGRVRAVRDGVQDAGVRTLGRAAVAGREAGNSVVVAHGGGWETQYAHLRKGSVAVRAGEAVEAGQRLGAVGLSGNTEFPHLHFEVRHKRAIVDPFAGSDTVAEGAPAKCESGGEPLWAQKAFEVLAYVPTGVLDADIAGAPPGVGDGNVDRDRMEAFTSTAAAAVFWAQIYGVRAGDVEELRLIAPDGSVAASRRARVERSQAQRLSYVGKRRGESAWQAGTYRGEYAVYRGPREEKIVSLTREITLGPDKHAAAARRAD